MKYSDTPMGKAFEISIKIGGEGEGEEENEKENELPEGVTNEAIKLAPAEADYVESLFEIVEEYGKLADDDGNGIWVGYVSAKDNAQKNIGVKCSNCAFWCPKMMGCHIIVKKAEPGGYCRLAAIGEGLVNKNKRTY